MLVEVAAILTALIAALLCFSLRRSLQTANDELKETLQERARLEAEVKSEREAHVRVLAVKDEQITKLNEMLTQTRGALTTELKAASAEALRDVSSQLVKTSEMDSGLRSQQIATMLKPVEETMKRIDKHIEDSNLARSRAEALLNDQVDRLAHASESLTNALRKPVIRGSWGEMTLENTLEAAGLEAGVDFVLQHSTDDADEGRKRTDAIVNLPKGRKLIIDSKNLMDSYLALVSAQDEAQRVQCLDQHSRSLRGHIRQLSSKEYWKRYEGLDCVILFIPHDGMYHAAIRDEADLIREACDRRVFVANPMSLIPLLKAVRYVLDQERLNRSAEEISAAGAELYSEIARFADNMGEVGKRLRKAVEAYNAAIPGLDRYLVAKSRTLKQLGCSRGPEPELPDPVELEPRLFSSRELRAVNQ